MSTTIQLGAPSGSSETTADGASSVPVIELNRLQVRFGNREILRGLTAALRGRAIGLLGPNGAGKSTLINTLLGFYKPVSGAARIFEKEVQSNLRELRAQIGYMPESDAFIAD